MKFNDIEGISKQLTALWKSYWGKKIEKIQENLVEFFKSSGQHLTKINDIEAISQVNHQSKRLKKCVNKSKKWKKLKKFHEYF